MGARGWNDNGLSMAAFTIRLRFARSSWSYVDMLWVGYEIVEEYSDCMDE